MDPRPIHPAATNKTFNPSTVPPCHIFNSFAPETKDPCLGTSMDTESFQLFQNQVNPNLSIGHPQVLLGSFDRNGNINSDLLQWITDTKTGPVAKTVSHRMIAQGNGYMNKPSPQSNMARHPNNTLARSSSTCFPQDGIHLELLGQASDFLREHESTINTYPNPSSFIPSDAVLMNATQLTVTPENVLGKNYPIHPVSSSQPYPVSNNPLELIQTTPSLNANLPTSTNLFSTNPTPNQTQQPPERRIIEKETQSDEKAGNDGKPKRKTAPKKTPKFDPNNPFGTLLNPNWKNERKNRNNNGGGVSMGTTDGGQQTNGLDEPTFTDYIVKRPNRGRPKGKRVHKLIIEEDEFGNKIERIEEIEIPQEVLKRNAWERKKSCAKRNYEKNKEKRRQHMKEYQRMKRQNPEIRKRHNELERERLRKKRGGPEVIEKLNNIGEPDEHELRPLSESGDDVSSLFFPQNNSRLNSEITTSALMQPNSYAPAPNTDFMFDPKTTASSLFNMNNKSQQVPLASNAGHFVPHPMTTSTFTYNIMHGSLTSEMMKNTKSAQPAGDQGSLMEYYPPSGILNQPKKGFNPSGNDVHIPLVGSFFVDKVGKPSPSSVPPSQTDFSGYQRNEELMSHMNKMLGNLPDSDSAFYAGSLLVQLRSEPSQSAPSAA